MRVPATTDDGVPFRVSRCRHQAIIETVMALMVLLLVSFALLQVGLYAKNLMIADHAAFVTGRSYVVGFKDDLVHRAQEVGSIGMAGKLETPASYSAMTQQELAAVEPQLIKDFLQSDGYTLYYEYWDRINRQLPGGNSDGMVDVSVNVSDYPLEIPMHRAYMSSDTIDFSGSVSMFNHAGLYLE